MGADTAGHGDSDLPSDLAKPALRALTAAGHTSLAQLAGVSEAELRRMHGVGPRAIRQLRQALAARGLTFRSDP